MCVRSYCCRLLQGNTETKFKYASKKALTATSTYKHNYSTSLKEEKIAVGDTNINYVQVGSGDHTVLCLPGALGSIWTDFKPQVVGLNKNKMTVVAWDPPGYGKSRPPARDFSEGFLSRDADCAAALMAALNIKRYSLLGWSDGGHTAMIMAGKFPERVDRLVVSGTNAFILPEEIKVFQSIRDVSKWSEQLRAPFVDLYGEKYFSEIWCAWVDAYVEIFARGGDVCRDTLPLIRCPTLVLHGAKDPMISIEHSKYLVDHIKNAKLCIFEDGKHNMHLKYSKEFNEVVQEFLLQ